ncbi:putative amine oxidase [Durotheca rogersii]|uniref:putative amine oxidase n=1 Tax=Durotheca rogersii TaxID=419775 RepID=UPI00221F09E7|nr:putative amine oxidase [Durotheca rogersii]KAI5862468.1 putative amine oxidase [Durotheca rogersii]
MAMVSFITDVIVIGAGLSGLQTAIGIQAAGHSCVVLEATDRVGGKTLSIKSDPNDKKGDGVVDVGAAWVNDSNQSEIWKLFDKYDIGAIIQRATGTSFLQADNGIVIPHPYHEQPLDDASAEEQRRVYEAIQTEIDAMDLERPERSPRARELDSVTFADYARKIGPHIGEQLASSAMASLLGVEADEVSALYAINYIKSGGGVHIIASDEKDGAQYIRGRRGMQAIAQGLASDLEPGTVRLNTVVKSVQQTAKGTYRVTSAKGAVFEAKHVVVSVPTSLYRTIDFSPPLPKLKQRLSASTSMGNYNKVVLVFDRPWWREAGLSGVMTTTSADLGPILFTRDTSSEKDGQWSISCFIAGDRARSWAKQPKAKRLKSVLDQFRAVFSTAASVPQPVAVHERIWSHDPFFRGAPSPVMGPGVLTTIGSDTLRKPVGKIHFVGTETAIVWKGYMDGAIRSGYRGAEEVVARLRAEE